MTYHLRVRPQVESDIEVAALWYEERQLGLGRELVYEVRQAMALRHRRYPVRWMFPNRFPYRIVFLTEGDVITVLCLVHSKRHDHVWKERLTRPDLPTEK